MKPGIERKLANASCYSVNRVPNDIYGTSKLEVIAEVVSICTRGFVICLFHPERTNFWRGHTRAIYTNTGIWVTNAPRRRWSLSFLPRPERTDTSELIYTRHCGEGYGRGYTSAHRLRRLRTQSCGHGQGDDISSRTMKHTFHTRTFLLRSSLKDMGDD